MRVDGTIACGPHIYTVHHCAENARTCRIQRTMSGTNVAVYGPDAAPAGPAGADGGLPRVGHTGFGPDADLRYFDLHRDAE